MISNLIAGISLAVMVICSIYAIQRYKSGKVKMETGVWFD